MSDFKLFDALRMFLGDVPWDFLLEAVIRVTFIYIVLVGALRLMGKRMGQQLSRNELAAMVSLAAAGGVPLLAPDGQVLGVLAADTTDSDEILGTPDAQLLLTAIGIGLAGSALIELWHRLAPKLPAAIVGDA